MACVKNVQAEYIFQKVNVSTVSFDSMKRWMFNDWMNVGGVNNGLYIVEKEIY